MKKLKVAFVALALVLGLGSAMAVTRDVPECQELNRARYSAPNDQSLITLGTYLTDWDCQGSQPVCHYVKIGDSFFACDETGVPTPIEK